MAIAIASIHMRMRFQSPMLRTSETAPMVQKLVRLATAPKTNASAKAPQTTVEASAAGLASFIGRPSATPGAHHLDLSADSTLLQPLFGFLGRRAGGIFLHQDAQRLPCRLLVAELGLRTGDVQHCIGRLGIIGPGCPHLLLGCDRHLVVPCLIVGIADP